MFSMNPNQNIGSFGAAIGGGSALAEAFARRGKDLSALQVQSPTSAGGAPPIPEAPPTTNPSIGTPQEAGAALAPEGIPQGAPQLQEPDTELKIALKALGGFIQSEGKLRRDLVTMRGQGIV